MVFSINSAHTPRLDYVVCASSAGTHRMAYWEWGDPDNERVLLCLHGLTRTGRDFDALARSLAVNYRVVCPDLVGRGHSDWLVDPELYAIPQYVSDILTLIARLNVDRIDCVGTSIGGLILLALAGSLNMSTRMQPRHARSFPPQLGVPLNKLILNDIGPEICSTGLQRIATNVAVPMSFDGFEEAKAYVRRSCTSYGNLADIEWEELTKEAFIRNETGQWVKQYDTAIAIPFQQQSQALQQTAQNLLWQAYECWPGKVLIVRGEHSDLLSQETADAMLQCHPQAQLHEFANVNYGPTFREKAQIAVARQFLLES